MSAKGARTAGIAGIGLALVLTGVALGAAPLPTAGRSYSDGVTLGKGKLAIAFVIGHNPRKIVSGKPVLGVPMSGGFLECPKTPHTSTGAPYVEFPFPATTLKLAGGKYTFSVSETETNLTFLGSSEKGKLKLKIKGMVASPRLITGSLTARGEGCTTGAVSFRAKLLATVSG